MSAPLVARLLLDACDEFARATNHVPEAAREVRPGGLNAPGWIAAHQAATLDTVINVLVQHRQPDAWCGEWLTEQRARPTPFDPPFDEARDALARVVEAATPYLEGCDEADLSRVAVPPDGPQWAAGRNAGYLMARAVGHTFVHAGELTVGTSLARAEDRDLGLPGALSRSAAGDGEDEAAPGPGIPLTVRLLLDARGEFARVAAAVPAGAQQSISERLNSGGWIVAHLAGQDDRFWNAGAQGLDADSWLGAVDLRAEPAPQPPYREALDALARVFERSGPYLERLDSASLSAPAAGRSRAGTGALVARAAAHAWAHAGELAAIASLAGADDPGLPGEMPHTTTWPG